MHAPARPIAQNDGRLNFHSSCGVGHHVSNTNNFACIAMMVQKYRDPAGRVNAFHLSRALRRGTCRQKTTLFSYCAAINHRFQVCRCAPEAFSGRTAAVQHRLRASGNSEPNAFLTGAALTVISRRNGGDRSPQDRVETMPGAARKSKAASGKGLGFGAYNFVA
jgi:hypothetical protein